MKASDEEIKKAYMEFLDLCRELQVEPPTFDEFVARETNLRVLGKIFHLESEDENVK